LPLSHQNEVVSVSHATGSDRPVCDFCGFVIDRPEKDCPALDDGRCQP